MLRPHVIMIDNYDSFTFNLVDCFRKFNCDVSVYRNSVSLDFIIKKMEEIKAPKCIVISPGPGTPREAGICLKLIKYFHQKIPLLGICLGHQGIAQAFGAKLFYDAVPSHGKPSRITLERNELFYGLPAKIQVGRYHSLYVKNLPDTFKSIAHHHHMIMAIQHKLFPVYGIQFHPESILSPLGERLIENFIYIVQVSSQAKGNSHA